MISAAWLSIIAALAGLSAAGPLEYELKPTRVAPGVYVFEGRPEGFSEANGGNILNTAFLVGPKGVVLVDTGPNQLYAQAMKAAIERVTTKPILRIYITHGHPDHFLGSQVFEGIPVFALAATQAHIEKDGEDLAENLYRLLAGWMRATSARTPTDTAEPGLVEVGGRKFRVLGFEGHTDGDLAIFDVKTKTLIAGDLVFKDRAPTTPNADLDLWRDALTALSALKPARVVPGHGPIHRGTIGIQQTRRYLDWLEKVLKQHAEQGSDMTEVLEPPRAPAALQRMAVFKEEFRRSVVHLYPDIEKASLSEVSKSRR